MVRMRTPVTEAGLRALDDLDPIDAVREAWANPGIHPEWHHQAQLVVRDAMPLLARALNRLEDHDTA